jgi:hypothetical protein
MASAAESEVGSLFMNGQEAISSRNCLIDMGHPQPATKMITDNNTAKGIIKGYKTKKIQINRHVLLLVKRPTRTRPI